MKRRLAREIAMQTLFQLEFSDINAELARQAVCQEREINEQEVSLDYVRILINGVTANKEAIDELICQHTNNWKIERMPAVDRNILRIAVYELLYSAETLTPNIIINEAIEISKIYGTDNSPKFINGILGKLSNVKK